MISLRKMLNRVADRRHLCLTQSKVHSDKKSIIKYGAGSDGNRNASL